MSLPHATPALPRRHISWKSMSILLLSGAIAATITLLLYFFRDNLLDLTGGEMALNHHGALAPVTEGLTVADAALWVSKILFQGPIPYLIISVIFASMFYAVVLELKGLVPRRAFEHKQISRLAKETNNQRDNRITKLEILLKGHAPEGNHLLQRLRLLDRVYDSVGTQEAVRDENDRLSAVSETAIAFCLQPLEYAMWILPILGFIGTVWGVTGAVEGLRNGINALFQAKGLTDLVRLNFMDGFKGLVLAFDTTLFGLVGLGLVGTHHWWLSRLASRWLNDVHKWTDRAIGLLREDSLLEHFFVVNKEGQLKRDKNERPILRWQEWMNLLQAGLLLTDADGNVVRDPQDHGRPVPRLERWMAQAFLQTDEHGEVAAGEDGKPILRWQEWMNLLQAGLLLTDADGNVVRDPQDHGRPVPRLERWMTQAFLQTDEHGEVAAGMDGKPIPRLLPALEKLQRGLMGEGADGQQSDSGRDTRMCLLDWAALVLRGLFMTDEQGHPQFYADTQIPITRAEPFQRQLLLMLLREIYEVTGNEAEAIAQGVVEGSTEPVPLRSRPERRHQETAKVLTLIAYLAERGDQQLAELIEVIHRTASDSPSHKSGPEATLRIVPPSGHPIDTLAASRAAFAVARLKTEETGENELLTGTFQSSPGGTLELPIQGPPLAVHERIVAAAIHETRLICAGDMDKSLMVLDLGGDGLPSDLTVLDQGEVLPGAMVVMPYEEMTQVLFLARTNGRIDLLAVPLQTDTMPAKLVKSYPGDLLAVTALAGTGMAWAVTAGNDEPSIHAVRTGSLPLDIRPGVPAVSLAFAPDEPSLLWFGTADGQLGALDITTGEPRHTLGSLPDIGLTDLLAVTRAGQLVATSAGQPRLHIIDPMDGSAIALTCAAAATCIVTSPDGRHLLAGLEDGSVVHLSGANRIGDGPS